MPTGLNLLHTNIGMAEESNNSFASKYFVRNQHRNLTDFCQDSGISSGTGLISARCQDEFAALPQDRRNARLSFQPRHKQALFFPHCTRKQSVYLGWLEPNLIKLKQSVYEVAWGNQVQNTAPPSLGCVVVRI